jgi:hypothetical protein
MNSQTCENFEHRLRGLQGSEVTEGGKVKKKSGLLTFAIKRRTPERYGLPSDIAWASYCYRMGFGFRILFHRSLQIGFLGGFFFFPLLWIFGSYSTIAARKDVFVGGWSLGFFFRVFETLVHRSPQMRLACGHWPCEGVKVDKKGCSR